MYAIRSYYAPVFCIANAIPKLAPITIRIDHSTLRRAELPLIARVRRNNFV